MHFLKLLGLHRRTRSDSALAPADLHLPNLPPSPIDAIFAVDVNTTSLLVAKKEQEQRHKHDLESRLETLKTQNAALKARLEQLKLRESAASQQFTTKLLPSSSASASTVKDIFVTASSCDQDTYTQAILATLGARRQAREAERVCVWWNRQAQVLDHGMGVRVSLSSFTCASSGSAEMVTPSVSTISVGGIERRWGFVWGVEAGMGALPSVLSVQFSPSWTEDGLANSCSNAIVNMTLTTSRSGNLQSLASSSSISQSQAHASTHQPSLTLAEPTDSTRSSPIRTQPETSLLPPSHSTQSLISSLSNLAEMVGKLSLPSRPSNASKHVSKNNSASPSRTPRSPARTKGDSDADSKTEPTLDLNLHVDDANSWLLTLAGDGGTNYSGGGDYDLVGDVSGDFFEDVSDDFITRVQAMMNWEENVEYEAQTQNQEGEAKNSDIATPPRFGGHPFSAQASPSPPVNTTPTRTASYDTHTTPSTMIFRTSRVASPPIASRCQPSPSPSPTPSSPPSRIASPTRPKPKSKQKHNTQPQPQPQPNMISTAKSNSILPTNPEIPAQRQPRSSLLTLLSLSRLNKKRPGGTRPTTRKGECEEEVKIQTREGKENKRSSCSPTPTPQNPNEEPSRNDKSKMTGRLSRLPTMRRRARV